MKLKALSIRQPWCDSILSGAKPVENRSWSTRYRGLIALHAAKTIDEEGIAWHRAGGHALAPRIETGAYLGVARLVDVVAAHESPWFFGPWGFVLTDPVRLQTPIPARGMLGLFTPADDDVPRIRAAARWAAFDMAEPGRAEA
jgi:hypothetical protein